MIIDLEYQDNYFFIDRVRKNHQQQSIVNFMSKPTPLLIYIDCVSGLCNRLRSIATIQALANYLRIPFKYMWVEGHQIESIGSLPGIINRAELEDIMKHHPNYYIFSEQLGHLDIHALFYNYLHITTHRLKELYASEAYKLIHAIIESKKLSGLYNQFIKHHRLYNYTAIHIRRTDMVHAFPEWNNGKQLTPVSYYIKYVRDNVDGPFFLCTDCIDVRNEFVNVLGDQVKMYDYVFDDTMFRQTGFVHSLLDLYTLSKGNVIVVTPPSSFSEFAHSAGNGTCIDLDEIYEI